MLADFIFVQASSPLFDCLLHSVTQRNRLLQFDGAGDNDRSCTLAVESIFEENWWGPKAANLRR